MLTGERQNGRPHGQRGDVLICPFAYCQRGSAGTLSVRKPTLSSPATAAHTPVLLSWLQGLPEEHRKIVEVCSRVKQKWTDPDFEPKDSSIWKQPEKHKGSSHHASVETRHALCARTWLTPMVCCALSVRTGEKIIWKRIEDICPRPSLFVDGVEPDDILQGTLGDCWFLGPLSGIRVPPPQCLKLVIASFGLPVFVTCVISDCTVSQLADELVQHIRVQPLGRVRAFDLSLLSLAVSCSC
jgi:hypothetical protein